jgi:hypothetical protein
MHTVNSNNALAPLYRSINSPLLQYIHTQDIIYHKGKYTFLWGEGIDARDARGLFSCFVVSPTLFTSATGSTSHLFHNLSANCVTVHKLSLMSLSGKNNGQDSSFPETDLLLVQLPLFLFRFSVSKHGDMI